MASTASAATAAIHGLSQLQQLLLQCNALEKSQKQALRELRTKMVSYENTLTRTLTLDHCVHAILEHGTRSPPPTTPTSTAGGSFASAPPPAGSKPGTTPASGAGGAPVSAAEEKELREREREREILSAVRRVNFVGNLFGYSQSVGYKQLIHHIRSHPALLAQALSAVCAPPVRWSADTIYRMEQLARSLVLDVYGGNTCVHDTTASSAASGLHSASSALRVQSLRASEYQFLRLMRDTCTLLYRRQLLAVTGPTAGAAGGAGLGSFSLLEHNSFSSKLLSGYLTRIGAEYLRRTIRETVQSIVLSDDYDFNTDLTSAHPTEPLFVICKKLITALLIAPTPPAGSNPARSGSASAAAAAAGSLVIMPYGVRYLARLLATLSDAATTLTAPQPATDSAAVAAPVPAPSPAPVQPTTTGVNHPLAPTPTPAPATSPSPPPPPAAPVQPPVVADLIFLQWIVNALMYPDAVGAGLVELHYPISSLARRNLQVVGTVILKLASGSRFATYQQSKYTPLNQFLDSFQPQMNAFLKQLTDVEELDQHFADVIEPHKSRAATALSTAAVSDTKSAPAAMGSGGINRALPAAADSSDPAVLGSPIAADEESETDQPSTSPALPATNFAGETVPTTQRLEPIAILPNDLFTLHRLLRSVLLNQQPTPSATRQRSAAAVEPTSTPTPVAPTPTPTPTPAPSGAAPPPTAASSIGTTTNPTPAPPANNTDPQRTATPPPAVAGAAVTAPVVSGTAPAPSVPSGVTATTAPAGGGGPIRLRLPPSRTVPLLTKTTTQLALLVAKSRARITKLLLSIGDPTPYVSTADNQYLLLDSGIAMLDAAEDDFEFKPDSFTAAASAPFQRFFDLITSAVTMLRPLPTTYAAPNSPYPTVLHVLRAEAEREWSLGNSARAAIVLECIELLDRTTPPELRSSTAAVSDVDSKSAAAADDFAPLVERVVSHYRAKQRWLLSNDVCGRALQSTGLIVEASDWLSGRDKLCTAALLDCQIARVLGAGTQPKIRGLISFLGKQDEQISRTPLVATSSHTQHLHQQSASASGKPAGGAPPPDPPYSDYMTPPPVKPPTRAPPHAQLTAPQQQSIANADSILSALFSAKPTPTTGKPGGPPPPQEVVLLPVCAGLCPDSLEDDRFLCENCQRRLDAHKRTAKSFTGKYAVVSERDVRLLPHSALAASNASGAVLSPNDPLVQSKISDYVVASAYSGMFVRCSRADQSWSAVIRLLQAVFPDFQSFYAFVNTKEDKRTVPASLLAPAPAPIARTSSTDSKQLPVALPVGAGKPPTPPPAPSPAGVDHSHSHAIDPSAVSSGGGGKHEKPLRYPHIGSFTFDTAIKELAGLDEVRSVHAKVLCFARCRDVISSVLQHSSLSSAGADDYIPALCYVLIRSNLSTLLSNIQFVRVFCDANQNHKGFVDVCVAVKYLAHLKTQLVTQQPLLIQRLLASLNPPPPPKPSAAASGTTPSGGASASVLLTTTGAVVGGGSGAGSGAGPASSLTGAALRDHLSGVMTGMGFADADIQAGLSALTATDLLTLDRAFPQLLDWLTDLNKLTGEMRYPRDFALKALLFVGPRNIAAATQYIDSLQLRG